MDPFDILPVRFHLGGAFDFDGDYVSYVGGRVEMSHIERDKLSLPELRGHLGDHVALTPEYNVDFHWLFPGEELSSGLRLLDNDKTCMLMSECITKGEVAEIYVEMYKYEGGGLVMWSHGSPSAVMRQEANRRFVIDLSPSKQQTTLDIQKVRAFYSSASNGREGDNEPEGIDAEDSDGKESEVEDTDAGHDSDIEDEEYLAGDEDNSEDDEEAREFRSNARNQRKNPTATVVPRAQVTVPRVPIYDSDDGDINHDIPDPPMMDSSDEASYDEDDQGEATRRETRFARYDSKAPIPRFCVGMTFRGRAEFKDALIKYGLAVRRHLRFPKDEKKRIRARCSWNGCPWMIFGSTRSDSDWFQVKTFNDVHICPRRKDNRLVTGRRIADRYERIIRANPSWKLLSIRETVLEEMGAHVTISKIKRAKSIVMKRIYEAAKGEYSKVFEYQAEILRSNPGSTVAVCLDPAYDMPVFQRIYVCFDACKKGFVAGCRKVIGVDGCFFKGACNGELICALGRDANNQIYPVAWAVVEKETEDSWFWFLGLLQKDIEIPVGGNGWVIISDQQKGLLNAVRDLFPDIEHRMCTRHIYANWRKKYRDQAFQKPFWQCAKASSIPFFNFCKAKLAQLTPAGAKDMMTTNTKHWSKAWFNLGSYCDSVDNNMCESFNNWIVDVRAHPIISMLEGIRTKVYVRIQQNRSRSTNWPGRICPNILKKLNKLIDQAENCSALWNGKYGFEVKEKDKKYKVDLETKTCSCRYWQLAGIPCAHAITALFISSKAPEDYITDYYSVDAYNKTYDHCMLPMEGMEQWPPTDHAKPEPPCYVKMPGRPRKERRREQGEVRKGTKLSKVGTISKCSRCHQQGHNTRTCPAAPTGGIMRRTLERAKEVYQGSKPQKRATKSAQAESSSRPQKRMRKPVGTAETNTQGEMPSQSSVRSTPVKKKKVAAKTRSSPRIKEAAKKKKSGTTN